MRGTREAIWLVLFHIPGKRLWAHLRAAAWRRVLILSLGLTPTGLRRPTRRRVVLGAFDSKTEDREHNADPFSLPLSFQSAKSLSLSTSYLPSFHIKKKMAPITVKKICCIGAGYVGGPTCAVM